MASWQGFKDFLFGTDPEDFRPYDPDATKLGDAHGAIPYVQGQLPGVQDRGAPQAGNVERYGGATIDQGPQSQFRQGQLGLMGTLEAAARGEGPSASGMAADRARDSMLAQTMALQAGRRGSSAAAGARAAQRGVAIGNQNIMGQEQVGRAGEMAQARGELGAVLGQGRGMDIGLATSQAGMTQQARLASMDAANRRDEYNAGLRFNQGAQNDQYGLGLLGLLGGMSQAELAARMQQEQLAAGQLSQGTPGILGSLLGAGGEIGGAYAYGKAMSDVNSKSGARRWTKAERQQHLGEQIIGGLAAIPAGYLAGKAKKKEKDAEEAEKAKTKADEDKRFYRQYEMTYGEKHPDDPSAPKTEPEPQADIGKWLMDQRDESIGPAPVDQYRIPTYTLPGLGTVPGYADGGIVTKPTVALIGEEGPEAVVPLSDRRKARTMMDAIEPMTYEYNGKAQAAGMPPGRQAGVMHQDLMKSELGRTMDAGRDKETGYKQVDYVKGLPAMMAGLADVNERLGRIEKKKGRR